MTASSLAAGTVAGWTAKMLADRAKVAVGGVNPSRDGPDGQSSSKQDHRRLFSSLRLTPCSPQVSARIP